MGFLLYPGRKKDDSGPRWYDWVLISGTFAACLHAYLNYWDFMLDPGTPETLDLIFGIFLIISVLELARRCIGWTFSFLIIFFIAYALLGHLIPGRLGHGVTRWQMLVDMLYLSTDGIWGILVAIFASLLSLFVIFSSVMISTGGANTIIEMAKFIGGRMRGGPAKIAVISSAMIGSISGSAVINVAMTGNFTIPMMKRLGYKSEVAGGIEATASSAGQITPPLMGAGLFLMAEFLEIEVPLIMLYAMVPALLFYIGVLSSVHFDSARFNIKPIPTDEIPKLRSFLQFSVWAPVILPFAVLISAIVLGYSVSLSVLFGIFTLLACYLVPSRSMTDLKNRLIKIVVAQAGTAKPLVSLCSLLCAAGLLIGVIGYVGIGVKFSEIVLTIGHGYLLPTLVLAGVVVIILGMGIPTTAAYVLSASVIAVAFQKLGIGELQAHMFIFYFATLSAITPPVCAAVFVAAGIAEADWMKVALHTVRFALIKYILPFLFIFHPSILLQGHPLIIFVTIATCSIGAVFLSASFSGYFISNLKPFERFLFGIGAIMMLWPEIYTSILGLFVLATMVFWNWKISQILLLRKHNINA